jgi:hypothetical protein
MEDTYNKFEEKYSWNNADGLKAFLTDILNVIASIARQIENFFKNFGLKYAFEDPNYNADNTEAE